MFGISKKIYFQHFLHSISGEVTKNVVASVLKNKHNKSIPNKLNGGRKK